MIAARMTLVDSEDVRVMAKAGEGAALPMDSKEGRNTCAYDSSQLHRARS